MADTQNSVGDMPTKMRDRRGPQYRRVHEIPEEGTVEFREHTQGLSNRLPMPSVESMRAGITICPQGLVRRYLVAGRTIGLSKEWALRLHVWVGRQIDALWPMEATPLEGLEQRAMAIEAQDDAAEKCHDLKQDAASLQVRLSTQSAEIAADQLVLAKLQRRLEEMRGCQ
jgi:hypothetical protein